MASTAASAVNAPPISQVSTKSERTKGLIGSAVAVTAWGGSGVAAKFVTIGGLAIVSYRFAAFVLVSLAIRWLTTRRTISWTAIKYSIPGGIALALDVAFYFSAIKITSVVNANIIGALQPLLLTIYGVKFLNEKISRNDIIYGLIALSGVVAIVVAGTNSEQSSLLGDLFAVGALLAWSAYFILAKQAKDKVSPGDYTIATAIMCAVINAPLALMFNQSLAWPSARNWFWILIVAALGGGVGHNMMNWSIPKIPLWLSSTMTLLVTPIAAALAWAFLDEPLNAIQIGALAVTLAAIGGLIMSNKEQPTSEPKHSAAG